MEPTNNFEQTKRYKNARHNCPDCVRPLKGHTQNVPAAAHPKNPTLAYQDFLSPNAVHRILEAQRQQEEARAATLRLDATTLMDEDLSLGDYNKLGVGWPIL